MSKSTQSCVSEGSTLEDLQGFRSLFPHEIITKYLIIIFSFNDERKKEEQNKRERKKNLN